MHNTTKKQDARKKKKHANATYNSSMQFHKHRKESNSKKQKERPGGGGGTTYYSYSSILTNYCPVLKTVWSPFSIYIRTGLQAEYLIFTREKRLENYYMVSICSQGILECLSIPHLS